jgi:very-short-patch-repair endonuclease
MDRAPGLVERTSSSQAKIALFRSLFRGREDVYPRRFESRKTGKAGYAPACVNEWVRGICEKPRIKCAECPNRRFLPVTDDVIRWHLSGRGPQGEPFVAGVYPLLLDETCFFLAVDFDKAGWREDATVFFEACRRMNLPAALERSRSGRGAHVWFFFEEAIPAALARRLASHVLTETMEGRPEVGLDSYDRLFPNQDTMPQGGFGNLIALPLQKGPRRQDNSVFLNDDFVPWADQWAFLASVRKIGRSQVERMVQDAERRGRILGVRLPPQDDGEEAPWTAPPSRHRKEPPIVGELPRTLELVLGNQIYIAKDGLHPGLRNRLLRLAAFQNPEFYKAQAMRLSTYDKPRVIGCAEDHPHHIGLPRGCLDEVRQALSDLHVRTAIRDERYIGHTLEVSFHGELRPEQKTAADEMLAHEIGVLAATTAFGKTVVAAWLIAQRRVNTFVLPVSWRGTIAQYAGRLHRLYDGKREVRVYDYADLNVPMLARMFDRRCRGYEAIGYTILLPASAIPGWPADVVLPSDPVWKRDYSGSVRRLVRDGVDSPLASLFVHVARTVAPDADGAHRARSATEAFLFKRLETLAETQRRFTVNVKLPIPFDGAGSLEVDLLCADARVAVELDGAQHLADPVAYRRDRRKDLLLQENGYLVLRFLAEDVGKELDMVLDAILRALSQRGTIVPASRLNFVRGGRP